MRCRSSQAALCTLPSLLLLAFAPRGPGMTPRPHPPRKTLFEFLPLLKWHPKGPSSSNLPGSPQPLVALLPLKLLIVSCVFTYWPHHAFTINSFSSSPSVHGEAIGLLSDVDVLCVNWEEWYLLSHRIALKSEWLVCRPSSADWYTVCMRWRTARKIKAALAAVSWGPGRRFTTEHKQHHKTPTSHEVTLWLWWSETKVRPLCHPAWRHTQTKITIAPQKYGVHLLG